MTVHYAAPAFTDEQWSRHVETWTDWIREAEDAFTDIQLLFVTTEPEADATRAFKERIFNETSLRHLHFLIDSDFMFDGYFEGYYEAPSMLLFDKNGKRFKVLSKETPAADLIKHFK